RRLQPGQRRHREAAGVAEAVEHTPEAPVPRQLGEAPAAVALIEVEAGLVAGGDVQRELPLVLADGELGGPAAAQPAGRGRQALALAAARIGALVELRQ